MKPKQAGLPRAAGRGHFPSNERPSFFFSRPARGVDPAASFCPGSRYCCFGRSCSFRMVAHTVHTYVPSVRRIDDPPCNRTNEEVECAREVEPSRTDPCSTQPVDYVLPPTTLSFETREFLVLCRRRNKGMHICTVNTCVSCEVWYVRRTSRA
ncbi:hypothetical protein FA13DRAFT_1281222 [Coprinellus micaceus]|uniref:Uncharacterized protein n=1 Tax=Coprinellus micaceus TaxID=71717 RepID=A0A4Y7SSS1_COPMI|nr:hypothetical protein FA13DRAFT_1281222 [Coprinellus micaceus]